MIPFLICFSSLTKLLNLIFRTSNQNLVPKSADEVEEGVEGREGVERAGEEEEGGRPPPRRQPIPAAPSTPPASPNFQYVCLW